MASPDAPQRATIANVFLLLLSLPLLTSAFVVNSNTTVEYGASPAALVLPYNATGTMTAKLAPRNTPYNYTSWTSLSSHQTSKWNFTVAASAPDAWTDTSVLTSELSVSWPTGEGMDAIPSNWTVCVLYMPDILNFGDGPSVGSACSSAIDSLFRASSLSSSSSYPSSCGSAKSYIVPKACTYDYSTGTYGSITGNFTIVSIAGANMTNNKPFLYQHDVGEPSFAVSMAKEWPLMVYEFTTYTYGRNYNGTTGISTVASSVTTYKTSAQYQVEKDNPIVITVYGTSDGEYNGTSAGAVMGRSWLIRGAWAALFAAAVLL